MSLKIPTERRPKYNITAVLIFTVFLAVHRLTIFVSLAVSLEVRQFIIVHDYKIFVTIYL